MQCIIDLKLLFYALTMEKGCGLVGTLCVTLEELHTERTGHQTHSDRVHSTQFLINPTYRQNEEQTEIRKINFASF